MFIDFISRILGAEKVSVSNRLENSAVPSVIVKKDSNKTSPKSIPEKYRKDVALLQSKYGDAFKTGFCINLTLQEALSIMPRERRRIDSYRGLQSYLKKDWNITLTIKSQKLNLKTMTNYFILNGKLLDTDMSAEEIESRVSESLDDT